MVHGDDDGLVLPPHVAPVECRVIPIAQHKEGVLDRSYALFDELKKAHKDIRSLAGAQIAAIGQGTAKVLEDRGILVDLIPEVYDGESLGEALAVKLQGGEKILLPRARKAIRSL